MLDIKRHQSIFNPFTLQMPVHIIGCGGMGSRVAEGLVRMGLGEDEEYPIFLYDPDSFEEHNLTNQWVTTRYLSAQKVVAVRDQMFEVNPQAIIGTYLGEVVEPIRFAGIVFVCIDSMTSRRVIIDEVLTKSPQVKCVIETRMDAGVGISHCFDPHNQNQLECWRMYWHSDDEADNMQGCGGSQSIISAIYATTAMALKQLEQFARNKKIEDVHNRVYQDFDACVLRKESWPTA